MNEIQRSDYLSVPSCQFEKTGLVIDESMTLDQWQEAGTFLRRVEGAVQWWIGDWLNFGEKKYGETYERALEETDYDSSTLRIIKHVSERIEMLRRRNNLSWGHHREVAALTPEDQDDWLDKAEEDSLSVHELRRQIGQAKRLPTPPLPEGVFDVIYADPPWKYEFSETHSREIENHYPTMPIEEICRLRIPAADNAVLFLWATAPKNEEALQVLNAWGFTYRTNAVWDKEKMGMGYWFRGQHELILVGVRGDFHPPEPEARVPSVIRQLRTEHSRKPDIVYGIIERMFPAGKYLELFSRSKREGWTMWGLNE